MLIRTVNPSSILQELWHPYQQLCPHLAHSLSRAFNASSLSRTTCFSPQITQLALLSLDLCFYQLLLLWNLHPGVKTVQRTSIANMSWSSHCQWNSSTVWLFLHRLLGVLALRLLYGIMGFHSILHRAGWVSYQLYFSHRSKTNLMLLLENSTSAPPAIIPCNEEP